MKRQKDVNINIRINSETRDRLRMYAEDVDMSMSQLIRMLINKELNIYESAKRNTKAGW